MNKWVQLKRGDDWGVEYVSAKPHDEGGYASYSRRIQVEHGDSIDVKWPDGTETTEKISCKKFSYHVSDMGHETNGWYELPGIIVDCRGVRVWAPLDSPGLMVAIED
jgi:hypothetical protein